MKPSVLLKSWKSTRALAALLLMTIATPVIGAGSERYSIYGWQDDAGVEHYTNELSEVPEVYRNRAVTLVKDWAAPEPPREDAASRATAETPPTTQPSPRAGTGVRRRAASRGHRRCRCLAKLFGGSRYAGSDAAAAAVR